MAQILSALKLVLAMWPIIKATILGLQSLFPGAGSAKLDALLQVIDAGAAEEPALAAMYADGKSKLSVVLNPLIALTKKDIPASSAQ